MSQRVKLGRLLWVVSVLVMFRSVPADAQVPVGWDVRGHIPEDYVMVRDTTVSRSGRASCSIKNVATAPDPDGFGTLRQAFRADQYQGKRIRLTASVRTSNIKGWASLWMRVDAPDNTVAFDNMVGRQLTGTSDWKQQAIVLDVPPQGEGILLGLMMSGTGQVWADDFVIEVVGSEVKSTDIGSGGGTGGPPAAVLRALPPQPSNLGCET